MAVPSFPMYGHVFPHEQGPELGDWNLNPHFHSVSNDLGHWDLVIYPMEYPKTTALISQLKMEGTTAVSPLFLNDGPGCSIWIWAKAPLVWEPVDNMFVGWNPMCVVNMFDYTNNYVLYKYIYIYVCMYVRRYVCMYVCIYVCVCMYIYIHSFIYLYVSAYACVFRSLHISNSWSSN